jgi:glycosyltransferase involved in cell wall biosynthesis
MNIAFLLAYEQSLHSGATRPFINWARVLGNKATTIVYRCPNSLNDSLRDIGRVRGFKLVSSNDFANLTEQLKEASFIFSDDYFSRLGLLSRIQEETGVKSAVYAQILHGIHCIARSFDKSTMDCKPRLMFSLGSLVPFKLISRKYSMLLGKPNKLIANSRFTASMLSLLYGVEVDEILYPPIDTDVFKPYDIRADGNEVVLYLGSNAGDTNSEFVSEIMRELISLDSVDKVNLFGNIAIHKQQETMFDNSKVNHLEEISDVELAKKYSQCILTVAPQNWETFGYVQMESILCGTPVLTLPTTPSAELVENKEVMTLACNRADFLESLRSLLAHTDELRSRKHKCSKYRLELLRSVSPKLSAEKLVTILSRS